MRKSIIALGFILANGAAIAQVNIHLTNSEVIEILAGNYNPNDYQPSVSFTDPHAIAAELSSRVNADSLRSYLKRMSAFETRNTGSDTISDSRGIGAARRWAYQMFEKFSNENESRL